MVVFLKKKLLVSIFLFGILLSVSSCYSTDYNVDSNNSPSVIILDRNVHGNVIKNTYINKYMPKTNFNRNLMNKLKKGSVVYRFGNGSGKKVLICAGMHGNEPQGPLAVLKFMSFLKGKHINGTIYIIPFAIPRTTGLNTRNYRGYDPNRKVSVKGSPANKILKFALANDIDYIMDIHAANGVESSGLIFYRNQFEKSWASYVKKRVKCNIRFQRTPGSLRMAASSKKINTITIEVNRKYSSNKAIYTELRMIKYSSQYLGLLKI